MSLQLDWTTKAKVTVKGAVAKITAATFTERGLEVQLRFYADVPSSKDGTPSFDDAVHTVPFDKAAPINAHTQAYAALKEFVTRIDRTSTKDADGKEVLTSTPVRPYENAIDV